MLIGGTLISTLELHGAMSLVIFMGLCPLKCRFCHNGELLDGGTETSFDDLKETIDSSKDFIDAIVVSGGEPLVQFEDLIDILEYTRSINLKTKIDTSGVYPEKLKKLLDLNLLDYVSMDIKAPFSKYKEITGADWGFKTKESMLLVNQYENVHLETRTTFVPTVHTKNDIEDIAKNNTSDIYTIQQFRNQNVLDESLKEVEPTNPHELKKLAISIKPLFNGTVKIKTAEFGEEVI